LYDRQRRPGRWRADPQRVVVGRAQSALRVKRPPVLGDRGPVAEPHALVPLDMLEQARQRSNPAGATDDAAVKANAHHAWSAFDSQAIEPVERITAVAEELLAGAEIAAALQAAVVVVEAIGDHQVSLARNLRPVGEIVVVRVAVIEKAAALEEEAPRVGARTPGVPADRSASDHAGEGVDVAQHVRPLHVLGDELIVDPALTVAGDLEATPHDLGGGCRITLERHPDGKDGGRG